MARYRLLSQHFNEDDVLLEAGDEVGDGCEHRWTRPPTTEMIGLDEEGRRLIERERQRVGERGNPVDALPMTMGEAEETPPRRKHRKPQPEPPPAADAADPGDEETAAG